jgi:DNA-binding response OmpR family regulator
MRILHLDDDRLQLELTHAWLTEAGHTVVSCAHSRDALRAVERDSFDLAVLDWMLPDISGEEVLQWIRKRNLRMPVLFATANDTEDEIAHILGLGADDYLVKPLRRREFLARVAALARRSAQASEAPRESMVLGPYRCQPDGASIFLNEVPVKMTPRMTALALLLFRKNGELVSRQRIYEEVWGHRERLDTRTVDTHVSRLRTALELDGRHGWRLTSVYQHGYRLEEVEPAAPK